MADDYPRWIVLESGQKVIAENETWHRAWTPKAFDRQQTDESKETPLQKEPLVRRAKRDTR